MVAIFARLLTSLVLVLGLYTLLWLPLIIGQAGAVGDQETAIGSETAPVTMIEYSSLTCPHCASFHIDTLPVLKERYIETGKLQLVLRDFPLDQRALDGAKVAHCAGPERYPAFIDVLFKSVDDWARADDHIAALKRIGRLGGLSPEEIDGCLNDPALEDRILARQLEGQQDYGVQSTPTFVINGEVVTGNRDPEEFAAIIEDKLGN
ncbi:MAG: DsbA family protein [Geminicoccaceae bacterium]